MPPTNSRRPDAATMESFLRFMETSLDANASQHLPAPGLHRLNRTEYANAIRDLLSLEVDATKFLPPDDSTRGFDNIAGALTMSPALMEAYLSASGKISRLAIGDVSAPTQAVFDVPADTAQNHHIEGLPFGTRGGMLIKHQFPADGLYSFNVKGVTGYFQAVLGQIQGEQLEVTIDGERVKLFDWDKEIKSTTGNGKSTPRIPVTAGLHTIGVTFIATNDLPGTELNRPFQRTMNTPGEIPGFQFYPHVGQVTIEGPFDAKGATETASRRKVFVCTPKTPREESACARTIVSTLARHAFRRPVNSADVNGLLEFYKARSRGRRQLRQRHRIGAAAHPCRSRVRLSRRAGAGQSRCRQELSDQRPRARVASLVLPLEQHPGRRTDRHCREGTAQGSGGARAAGASHAARSEVAGACGQLHRAVAGCARAEDRRAGRESVPRLRRQPAQRVPARSRTVLRQHHPGRPERRRSAERERHVRQRAPREALRNPQHLRPAVPARHAAGGTRYAARAARQGRADDGDVSRGAHVAGDTRQVVPADVPRCRAAAAAA